MKKYLIISLLVLTLSVSMTTAATTDFTANGNVTVTGVALVGGGVVDLLILNGSTAESWTVDGGVFKVTNPGTYFRVGSSDSMVKAIEAGSNAGSTISCAPNTTLGTSYVELTIANASQNTIIPYTQVSHCDGGTLGGSVGGGGPKKTKATPATPAVPALPALTNASVNASFNRPLSLNSRGEDVKRLQKFLNSSLDTVIALTGIGSAGNETDFFGGLTKQALGKFQLKHNLITSSDDPAFGFLGPKTRAKISELSASVVAPVSDNQVLIQSLTVQLQDLINQLNVLKAAGSN